MKQILLIFSLVFLFELAYSQTDDNEYFKKNNIKQVKTTNYIGVEDSTPIVNITKYNKQGLVISTITFDKNNKQHSEFEYLYDDKNNKTLTIENGKKDSKNELHYEYGTSGLIIKEWNSFFSDKYFYSSENKVSKIIHTNKERNETKEILFEYDKNGNEISEYVDGLPFHLNTYRKYDLNNNKVEETIYYHNADKNELYSKCQYSYNSNNQLVSKVYIDGYAKSNNVKYTYYSNGNLHTIETENETIIELFYDSKNLIIKKSLNYIKYNMLIVSKYEYEFYE